jgi:hypothetical protein
MKIDPINFSESVLIIGEVAGGVACFGIFRLLLRWKGDSESASTNSSQLLSLVFAGRHPGKSKSSKDS